MSKSSDRVSSLKKIADLLTGLSLQVKALTLSGDSSVNAHMEMIYMQILNHIYGLQLKNLNHLTLNYPALDLVDEQNRVAVQITASANMGQIDRTLEQFFSHNLHKKIDRLFIVLTTERTAAFYPAQLKRRTERFGKDIPSENFLTVLDHAAIYKEAVAMNDQRINLRLIQILEKETGGLTGLRSAPASPPKTILVAFSEDNYHVVLGVVEKLLRSNVQVYHSSSRLQAELNEFVNLYLLRSETQQPMDFCVLVLSDDFIVNKWQSNRPCHILTSAFNQKSTVIIPYYHNLTIRVPASISSNYQAIPVELTLNNVQQIVNEIIGRFDPHSSTSVVRQLQEHKEFEKILQLTGSGYTYRPVAEEKGLGFHIFEQINPFNDLKILFIFILPGANQQRSYQHIVQEYGSENLLRSWILLLKDPDRKESNIRFENIRKLFNPYRIIYLDQYVWEFCTPKEFRENAQRFNIKNFVTPNLYDESEQPISVENLFEWLVKPQLPVLVLKGSGGIGKTTLAQMLGDRFLDDNPASRVIFINSREILNNLRNQRQPNVGIDLYSFYHATIDTDTHLDSEKFMVNMDHGNILMIIDGLDEVMASIPQFDANDFFNSIRKYTPFIGNAKVLITCRNYFWDNSQIQRTDDLSCIEILPFDDGLAKTYFTMRHANSPNRVQKSMRLAHQLAYYNENTGPAEYLPFVLSIIDDWVENQQIEEEEHEPDNFFTSIYLNEKNPSDFILHGICTREQLKMNETMTVDKQLKLFIDFSLCNITPTNHADPNPHLLKGQFIALANAIFPNISESALLSLLAHAFVEIAGEIVSFRFDFLADYFKNIFISHALRTETDPDFKLIMILASHAKYYSSFMKEIAIRIDQVLDDDSPLMYRIYDLLDYIRLNEDGLDIAFIHKAVSGLFSTALHLKNRQNTPNITGNTLLLKNLFEKDKQINHLALIDVLSFDDSKRILFDFSGLRFINCHFNNYAYFWNCKMDSDTRFENCYFRNMRADEISNNLRIGIGQFPDCDMDDSFREVLEKIQPDDVLEKDLKLQDLRKLLLLFQVQGRLSTRSREHVLEKKYVKRIFSLEQLLAFLTKHGVLNFSIDQKDGLLVTEKFQSDVQRYLNEGVRAPNLKRIINALINEPAEP